MHLILLRNWKFSSVSISENSVTHYGQFFVDFVKNAYYSTSFHIITSSK